MTIPHEGFFLPDTANTPAVRDPAYTLNRDHESRADVRERLDRIWSRARHLVGDTHFREKARDDFESAAWHLSVLDALLDARLDVRSTRPAGPDVQVVLGSQTVSIEAVVARPGNTIDAARTPMHGRAYTPDDNGILLRHVNALTSKVAQFREWVTKGLVLPSEPFVIALEAGLVPDAFMLERDEIGYCEQALFGVGDEQFQFAVGSGELVGRSFARRPTVRKASGAIVKLDLVSDPSFACVSAVLYTPYHFAARLSGDLPKRLIHNPKAAVPLPHGALGGIGRELWLDEDGSLVWSRPT